MLEEFIFYCFAILLLMSASMVVIARNSVHAALSLVLSFFFCSAIWLLLRAEFLAILLVLLYVGAVMVLFLFVVMMLDVNVSVAQGRLTRYLPLALLVAVAMVVSMGLVVGTHYFSGDRYLAGIVQEDNLMNTEALGRVLYTEYLFQFELAGVILLVAIIAAITLTLRTVKRSKTPDPGDQVQIKRQERVKLVKMETEPR